MCRVNVHMKGLAPKSPSRMCSFSVKNTFCVFRSRCKTWATPFPGDLLLLTIALRGLLEHWVNQVVQAVAAVLDRDWDGRVSRRPQIAPL